MKKKSAMVYVRNREEILGLQTSDSQAGRLAAVNQSMVTFDNNIGTMDEMERRVDG